MSLSSAIYKILSDISLDILPPLLPPIPRNNVQLEGTKPSPGVGSSLFCYMPLAIWYTLSIRHPSAILSDILFSARHSLYEISHVCHENGLLAIVVHNSRLGNICVPFGHFFGHFFGHPPGE